MLPSSVMHEWFEQVWNRGDASAIDRLLAPDATMHNFDQLGNDAQGSASFVERYHRFRAAFPDLHFTLHDAFESGAYTAGRWTFTGTHTGNGLDIPPTHRKIEFAGMSFARIENGRAAEVWDSWDANGMMKQLGRNESAMAAAAV